MIPLANNESCKSEHFLNFANSSIFVLCLKSLVQSAKWFVLIVNHFVVLFLQIGYQLTSGQTGCFSERQLDELD